MSDRRTMRRLEKALDVELRGLKNDLLRDKHAVLRALRGGQSLHGQIEIRPEALGEDR